MSSSQHVADWGSAIDALLDEDQSQDSGEYEYESEVEEPDNDNDNECSYVNLVNAGMGTTAVSVTAVKKRDFAIIVDKDMETEDNGDDDWSQVSVSDVSDTRKKLKNTKITDTKTQNSNTSDDLSTASSWNLVRGEGREGISRAGSATSSLATGKTNQSTSGFVVVAGANSDRCSTMPLLSSCSAQMQRSDLAAKMPQLNLPSAALNHVSCPRCTLENLPGVQTCAACELPITANPQTDIDHKIALRLAVVMEEEGNQTAAANGGTVALQDMQSLLLDGDIRPRPVQERPSGNLTIHKAYQWVDVILKAIQDMSTTLTNQKICTVVSTVAEKKDRLIEFLVRFQEQQQLHGESRTGLPLTLGYVLTSRDCQDVWEQGLAVEEACDCVVRIVSADPAQQIYLGEIPDYVWLVLFNRNAPKPRRSNSHISKCGSMKGRDREEDPWRTVGESSRCGVDTGLVYGKNVVPLLCTANANFRRPYKPRRNTIHDDKRVQYSTSEARDQTKKYSQAYIKLFDALFPSIGTDY